jgi:hypothetical protein
MWQDGCCRPAASERQIEAYNVQKLERIRREFALILALSLFALRSPDVWHPALIFWFRSLGSAIAGTDSDWGGPYLLLYGLQGALSAWPVLLAALELPLHLLPTCARPSG